MGASKDATSAAWDIPAHDIHEYRARQTQYCVCVFVLNEGDRIQAQLTRMQPFAALADLIIADGGSTDGVLTRETLVPAGVRTLLVKTGPGRLSAQMRMALAYAMREGYDGAVVIDGNNKDDPTTLPVFLSMLDAGADHVQGSRYIPGGRAIRTPLDRHLGVRLIHAPLVSLAAGTRYTDTTNGFRAYSRRLLLDPRVLPFRDVFSGYELHYYLAIRAARLGFQVMEIPVTRAYPASGAVPSKITSVRGKVQVLRTLIRAVLHRFDPS